MHPFMKLTLANNKATIYINYLDIVAIQPVQNDGCVLTMTNKLTYHVAQHSDQVFHIITMMETDHA
jgi:hypothetical protein